MLNIKWALRQDRLLRALTGLNRKAFQSLLSAFTPVYEEIRYYQSAKLTASKDL